MDGLIGRNIIEIAPCMKENETYQQSLKVLETGDPVRVVSWISVPGAEKRLYDQKYFKVGDGLGVIATDITEHMESDEKLRVASEYSRSLIEASLDPLITISPDGKILDVNTATEDATGVPREELIGSDFLNYFTEPEKARAGYRQVFTEGFVRDYPLAMRHKSGKITDVLYNATVYRNHKGEVQGVFAAARDVTEKKEMEEKLRHAEKMEAVSRMSAMIAHDLRGPLSTVNQAAELIKRSPERTDKLLRMIKSNTTRALNMIEEVRAGTKEIEPKLEETDFGAMIKTTTEEARIPDNVKVKLVISKGLESVQLDTGVIRRALDNLVSNAVESMSEGGTITLRARKDAGQVCVEVSDTGSGIPDEAIPHMFETFYSTKPKGLGLGLPYCRRAVEAHGGTLNFTSKKGKGTTFTMTIPAEGN